MDSIVLKVMIFTCANSNFIVGIFYLTVTTVTNSMDGRSVGDVSCGVAVSNHYRIAYLHKLTMKSISTPHYFRCLYWYKKWEDIEPFFQIELKLHRPYE